MIKFKNLNTGEIKTAFSLREDGEKAYIKFSSDRKEYGYFKSNIEIVTSDTNQLPFRVYVYTKDCYKCHKPTEILTYITYADKPTENVMFPCEYNRLLEHQNIVAHLQDPSIEYYGINVIGDIEEFDNIIPNHAKIALIKNEAILIEVLIEVASFLYLYITSSAFKVNRNFSHAAVDTDYILTVAVYTMYFLFLEIS